MGKKTVVEVAKYVLTKCGDMPAMKLHKIVYYCQAWSLAWDEVPLFEEEFKACAYGPVSPDLFSSHKGKFVINEEDIKGDIDDFDQDALDTMNAVIDYYGDKPPQWLSNLTHQELPRKNARKGYAPGESCNVVISKEAMQSYYGGL